MRIRSLPVVCALTLLPLTATAQTGAISGTVTAAGTSTPPPFVTVYAYDPDGEFAGSAAPDGAGAYVITPLAPGTYYLSTGVAIGFINEIYDNIPCIAHCTFNVNAILAGTPVIVAAGATTANRDFQLDPGGQIRGRVLDGATSSPLAGVFVTIRNSSGGPVENRTTNSLGEYTTRVGLVSGTYYAFTTNSAGYFDEIYDDRRCDEGGCHSDAHVVGTPIVVTAPGPTTGIDFRLTKGASMAGTITNAGTGAVLTGVNVYVVRPSGEPAGSATTGPTGTYLTSALDAGSYYLYTANNAGYIDERYDNVPCPGPCQSVSGGTIVTIAEGQAATGLNFALSAGGRISGTIRHAATLTPLSGIAVYFFSSTGVFVGNTYSGADGSYASLTGLLTGTYYAHTDNSQGYLEEFYDNVPCGAAFCQGAALQGTPIAVTLGMTTSGRDFLLDRGGQIKGQVTRPDGAGVQGVTVQAFDSLGRSTAAQTNSAGHYTIAELRPGSYYLLTSGAASRGLVNEIHHDIVCPGACSSATAKAIGARVTVGFEGVVENIDFALAAGGSVTGIITDAGTGAPVQNAAVQLVNSTMTAFPFSANTGPSGTFTIGGLATGTYYASTFNSAGYIDEIYPGIACAGPCGTGQSMAGTPIAVTIGAVTGGVNFALSRGGGRISGRVTEAATGTGLINPQVNFANASGQTVSALRTDASGQYVSAFLPPGSYYVYTRDAGQRSTSSPGLLMELFGNVPCASDCIAEIAAGAATPVTVADGATTPGVDIALDVGGSVSGVVTDAATGVRLDSVRVDFHDSAGRYATSGFSQAGDYRTGGLLAGTYYAFTRDAALHVNEVYDDIPCPAGCTPSKASSGTPITVTGVAETTGRNFALARRAGAPGPPLNVEAITSALGLLVRWTAPVAGGAAASYLIEAGLTPGTTALNFSTADTEYLFAGAPPGVYFLRVKGVNTAGTGPASAEFTLTIGAGGAPPAAPRFPRATMVGTRVLLEWRAAETGGAATDYLVEAGSATGLANIAAIPAAGLAFTYDPVPNGFYFLRVRARNASGTSAPSSEVMIVAGGVPAPPLAPTGFASTVNGSTVTLNWTAPPAPVTGYVVEAGSATGLSNLAVLPLGPSVTASFPGIPPGTYYVRIRAVNALGRGVVSDEIVIVVGG